MQVQPSDNRVRKLEKSSQQVDTLNMEEEQTPATTSPAKSSISDLHSSEFYNPSDFEVTQNIWQQEVCDGGTEIPQGLTLKH